MFDYAFILKGKKAIIKPDLLEAHLDPWRLSVLMYVYWHIFFLIFCLIQVEPTKRRCFQKSLEKLKMCHASSLRNSRISCYQVSVITWLCL